MARRQSRATVWRIEIAFGEHARQIKVWSNGEKMQLAPVDSTLVGYVPPRSDPGTGRGAHTWRPDPKTWEEIKQHSVEIACHGHHHRLCQPEGPRAALSAQANDSNFKGPRRRAHLLPRRAIDSARS
jgi:hypothetical protein